MRKPTKVIQLLIYGAIYALVGTPVVAFWPILTMPGTGNLFEKIRNDNVETSGVVTSVEASKIIYGYNTPSFPRQPWSFRREQKVGAQQVTRYQVGMTIPVEYSRTVEGASRVKGYGNGSVLLREQIQILIMLEGANLTGYLLAFLLLRRKKVR